MAREIQLATHTLQAAYSMAVLLERMSASKDYVQTVRALSTAAVGACQALSTVGPLLNPVTEHEVVVAVACHLVRAHGELSRQRSSMASLACRDLERAVDLLSRMTEISWPTAETEETYAE
jgi:hypothetical protein